MTLAAGRPTRSALLPAHERIAVTAWPDVLQRVMKRLQRATMIGTAPKGFKRRRRPPQRYTARPLLQVGL